MTKEQLIDELMPLLRDKIVVGHALKNDFATLKLPERPATRDTAKFYRFVSGKGRPRKLKELTWEFLGRSIQLGEHCSMEDAKAALDLYKEFSDEWERLGPNGVVSTRAPSVAQALLQPVRITDARVDSSWSSKLMLLSMDLGHGDRRQAVAPIRGCASTRELIGEHVVALVNTKSRKIGGTKSRACILTCNGRIVRAPAGAELGERALPEEWTPQKKPPTVCHESVVRDILGRLSECEDCTVCLNGQPLTVGAHGYAWLPSEEA